MVRRRSEGKEAGISIGFQLPAASLAGGDDSG